MSQNKKKKKVFEIYKKFFTLVFKHILTTSFYKLKFGNIFFNYFDFLLFTNKFNFFLIKNYNNIVFEKNIILRFNIYNNLTVGLNLDKNFIWFDTNINNHFKVFSSFKINNKYFLRKNNNQSNLIKKINNIVYLKKKCGFFKKNNKINHYNLSRLSFFKNHTYSDLDFFYKNQSEFKHKINKNYFNFFNESKEFNKFVELKKRTFHMFFNNRLILKNFFMLTKKKQFRVSKFFYFFLKSNLKNFINFFEFSLFNFLVKTKLVFSFKESLFFIKNGLVCVNGLVVSDLFFQLSSGDVVQLTISSNYFDYFKINLDKKLKIMNQLKYIVWKLNRFKNNFYKQSSNNVPSFVTDLSNFYDDVPIFIEIDYSILSATILYKDIKIEQHNSNLLQSLNLFLLRNYNWKYLV